jgi:putative nucleotidyltransferase with HDIG domain
VSGPRFLNAVAQALAAMSLYQDGHPARERALDAAFLALDDLQARAPRQTFTFLAGEVVHGQEPLPEMRGWEWAERLARAGVQRLEFDERVERAELEALLDEVLSRISLSGADSPELRQMRSTRARFGAVGLRGDAAAEAPVPAADVDIVSPDAYPLVEEAEAVRWVHGEVEARRALPLAEAEAVVRSLGVAMHGERRMVLPLVRLREFDEYTTTHSLNVAVLSMALTEYLGHGSAEVRAAGVAGLLHDVGKVNIPRDLLNKPGKLTAQEREVMNRHPVDGARILLESEGRLELAAMVAYEHHLMHAGGGYPDLRFDRTCHACSRLAHVCDVYDALRTRRPYRDAWENERVLAYIEERAGTEFDPAFAQPFVRMMREWEVRTAVLDGGDIAPDAGGASPSPDGDGSPPTATQASG